MTPIEPVEIQLDKPRQILINHAALYRAEAEINKRRYAKPDDYTAIDVIMVSAFNNLFRSLGMLPMDLLLVMLWAGLVCEKDEKRLSVDQVAALLDSPGVDRAAISGTLWGAYYKVAGKNLTVVGDEETPEKKSDQSQPTGSPSGQSGATTLN